MNEYLITGEILCWRGVIRVCQTVFANTREEAYKAAVNYSEYGRISGFNLRVIELTYTEAHNYELQPEPPREITGVIEFSHKLLPEKI